MPQLVDSFAASATVGLTTRSAAANGAEARNCDCRKGYTAAAVGGVGVLVAAPLAILAIGFGPLGIAAGSLAAGMMSTAATTGVGAGLVAAGQAAGAAGLTVGAKAALAGAGAAIGISASGGCDCE